MLNFIALAALPAVLLLAVAACDGEPQAPAASAAAPAHLTMPATAWAPQAQYEEARLSPFDPVRSTDSERFSAAPRN